MNAKILLFILLGAFLFTTKIYAATIVDYVPKGSSATGEGYNGPVDQSKCSSIPKPPDLCSNSDSRDSTTCSGEAPCRTGGDFWAKYNLLGCFEDAMDPTATAWLYNYTDTVCSIADKCGDANGANTGPYLNAGFCNCSVGGIYKVCCSNGSLASSSCVQLSQDTTNPPFEGVCPSGTTTVQCGGAGQPPCNATACGGPPPTTTKYYKCSSGACVQDNTSGTFPNDATCGNTCNTSCPNFAPPATRTTSGSCPANTTCIAQQDPLTVQTSCTPTGSQCSPSCSFTCRDSLGRTCPATSCTTTWQCNGSSWYNGGQYYYTCPSSCSVCTPGQTQTVCGTQQNQCRVP